MTLAPFTPRLRPYYRLDWLGTLPVTNKVYGKLKITKAVRPPSLWQTNFKSTGISVINYYLQLIYSTKKNLSSKQKNLVVRTNIQNYPRQWYRCPRHLALCDSGIITRLNNWLQYRWLIIFMYNLWITKSVWPPSLWKTDCKLTGIPRTFALICFIFSGLNTMYFLVACD